MFSGFWDCLSQQRGFTSLVASQWTSFLSCFSFSTSDACHRSWLCFWWVLEWKCPDATANSSLWPPIPGMQTEQRRFLPSCVREDILPQLCLKGLRQDRDVWQALLYQLQLHHIYISWGCGFGFWLQLLVESGNPSFSTVMPFFLFTWNPSVGDGSLNRKIWWLKRKMWISFHRKKENHSLQGKMWWASSLQLPFPTLSCRSSRGLQNLRFHKIWLSLITRLKY